MGNCDKSLRITTYILFILLLLTEITAIVSNIMCFCKEEQIVLEITTLVSLVLSIISILSITIFGIHSLYFRKTTLFLWYIIISSIFLLIQIGFVIWVIMKEQKETVLNTKLLIIITKCVCAFFYFIRSELWFGGLIFSIEFGNFLAIMSTSIFSSSVFSPFFPHMLMCLWCPIAHFSP